MLKPKYQFAGLLQLFLTGLAMFLFIQCGKDAGQASPTEVVVTRVVQRNVTIYEEFVGQTYGLSDIAIKARVDGFLEGIHFDEGFPVRKGQLLYTIDPQPFEARVAEAMGRVAEAKTRLVQANNDLERYRPLAEINAISQKDLDAAEANYGAAQAAVEAAEASLRSAQIELGYTKIYAPIQGIIGKSLAKVGDYIGRDPGSTNINTISRIDTILVEFFLPESKYLEIMRYEGIRSDAMQRPENRRTSLELILADGTVHDQRGKIKFVNRQVDANTGSILIQATFANPEGLIRPGQFARVRGSVDEIENALLVPQKAVTELQGQFSVFVVNDSSIVQFQSIVINQPVDDMWLVTEGLNAGDRVIYEGIMKVRSGMPVNPVEEQFKSVNEANNQ